MKITLDLRTVIAILSIVTLIAGGVAHLYSTFATKSALLGIEGEVEKIKWYLIQMERTGNLPVFEGPHAPEEEEDG